MLAELGGTLPELRPEDHRIAQGNRVKETRDKRLKC